MPQRPAVACVAEAVRDPRVLGTTVDLSSGEAQKDGVLAGARWRQVGRSMANGCP